MKARWLVSVRKTEGLALDARVALDRVLADFGPKATQSVTTVRHREEVGAAAAHHTPRRCV